MPVPALGTVTVVALDSVAITAFVRTRDMYDAWLRAGGMSDYQVPAGRWSAVRECEDA